MREQSGQRSNSFKYVAQIGHPTDEETGLIYMRARYYDPEVGRFMSEDSKRNGINWFVYAKANPINNIDPDGCKDIWDIWWNYAFWRLGLIFAVAAYLAIRIGDERMQNPMKAYGIATSLAIIATGFFALASIGVVNSDILTALGGIIAIFSGTISLILTNYGEIPTAIAGGITDTAVLTTFIYSLAVLGAIAASYVYEN